MNAIVILPDGATHLLSDLDTLPEPSWVSLDTSRDSAEQIRHVLRDTFGFHPVAIESALESDQRPRIDDYEGFTHIITVGITSSGQLDEVDIFVTPSHVVTLHRGTSTSLDQVIKNIAAHPVSTKSPFPVVVSFLIMDTVVDTYFPLLASMDDAIDDLEMAILKNPTEDQLSTLFEMKRQIMQIRKAVNPQRDMISALNAGVTSIPGLTEDSSNYFRSLYDHFIRVNDLVDSYRDLVTGAMDTHLAMVSNRLNVVMKQLAIISTLFLPLSFLTGFFGQNFSWPIAHWYSSRLQFLIVGIGLDIVAVAGVFLLFRKRGWLKRDSLA